MDPRFPALPAELTIYAAGELRARWLAALDATADGETLWVDASGVAEVDGAGVQLLVSLSRHLAARDRVLRLESPSDALRDACTTLGAGVLEATRGETTGVCP
jgi:anti-anti-sigma regulatory factor